MERRDSFDAVAGLYAEARPGYCAALFQDLAALAGLGPRSRMLEVGCGPGQATADLASVGGALTAIDPGPNLIAEARLRAGVEGVTFAVCRFEDFETPEGSFDLVASAQAWHWIAPDVAFAKAALLLRPGGSLAIFGHVPMPVEGAIGKAFEVAYDEFAPGTWGTPHPASSYLASGPWPELFARSGLFGAVAHRGYAWTRVMDPGQLGRYLRTDSTFHALPEDRRFALFDRMCAAVEQAGGRIEAPWETHLYVAARG